jgi:hypothetical protein
MQRFLGTFAVMMLTLNVIGCSRGPGDQPELGHVTGIVTFEDQPLAGASIVFQPEGGRPSKGKTNEDGRYELVYIRNVKGCKTGICTVRITKFNEEDEEEFNEEGGDGETSTPRPAKVQKEPIPARYNVNSELAAEVRPGPNTINFDLKK